MLRLLSSIFFLFLSTFVYIFHNSCLAHTFVFIQRFTARDAKSLLITIHNSERASIMAEDCRYEVDNLREINFLIARMAAFRLKRDASAKVEESGEINFLITWSQLALRKIFIASTGASCSGKMNRSSFRVKLLQTEKFANRNFTIL